MKIFWAIILVLALAAGVLLARGGRNRSAPAEPIASAGTLAGNPTQPVASLPAEAPAPAPATEAAAIEPAREAEPATETESAVAGAARNAEAESADAAEDEAPVSAPAPDPLEPVAAAPDDRESPVEPPPSGAADHDARATEQARQIAEQAEAAREAEAAAAAEAPTGPSIRINDKWTVPGDGSAANPYVVPWEVLVSAGREYNPREGKTELPEWAAQLDGKRVRLTGFLLFPIVATDADELLVMYNQWDGCCIGIPPTPYDSVEVKLSEPASKDAWRFNYGSVTGVLNVDPYLAGKWLVSLYVLEDAGLEASGL